MLHQICETLINMTKEAKAQTSLKWGHKVTKFVKGGRTSEKQILVWYFLFHFSIVQHLPLQSILAAVLFFLFTVNVVVIDSSLLL